VTLLRAAAAAFCFLGLSSAGVSAQQERDPLSRGFDLERRGATAAAATAYREALAARPSDLAALLGLERVLTSLERQVEILPSLQAALAGNPRSGPLWGVGVRVWTALGETDSARAAMDRWAEVAPGSDDPWRELGRALLARRDRQGARRAYLEGRERLGEPAALAAELAELLTLEGRYTDAAREWALATRTVDGYRHTAASALAPAPPNQRGAILKTLQESGGEAASTAAMLAARWGDPVAGFHMLAAALPEENSRAAVRLREFLEQVSPAESPAAWHAQALALEALAGKVPATQAPRIRSDAARAYAEAGRPEDARRMLGDLAVDASAPRAMQSGAATTLVALLADEGKLEEAQARLGDLGAASPAERAALTRRVALGWARQGELDKAEALVASDSSVDGLAVRGRLRLFRGDVAGARQLLVAAGPFAGGREASAGRLALLALVQPIERAQVPTLGAALLAAERGDTTAAVKELERTAADLGATGGGPELLLLAGRMELGRNAPESAERRFLAATDFRNSSAAPAALLELARMALARGQPGEAIPYLETLILEHAPSALVPQARRLLDEAKGAVPRS
jgi:hypothetical protein